MRLSTAGSILPSPLVSIYAGHQPCGLLRVSCLIEDSSIEPAERLPARSLKYKCCLCRIELQVVRVEASIDGSEFLRFRIVDRGVLARCRQRKYFAKGRVW